MLQPGRKYSAGNGYRYGFNGQEKEKEINENSTSAEYWIYDSRIGRRWNVDPKPNVSNSVYSCLANNPIWFSDPDGDTAAVRVKNQEYRYVGNQWINAKTRDVIKVSDVNKKWARQLMLNYSELNSIKDYSLVTNKINNSTTTVLLGKRKESETMGQNYLNGDKREIQVYINVKGKLLKGIAENMASPSPTHNRIDSDLPSLVILAHELGHVFDLLEGKPKSFFEGSIVTNKILVALAIITISSSETNAMYWENVVRIHSNLPLRVMYEDEDKQKYWRRNISFRNNDALVEYDRDPTKKKIIGVTIKDLDGHTLYRKN
jgi:RHS repeat-associated protein